MEVLSIRGDNVDIRVSVDFLDLLKSRRILLHRDPSIQRWQPGDVVQICRSSTIEPYTSFRFGNFLCSAGAFSSILSHLGPGAKVGRFSSIAPHCTIMGFRHPIEAVSQSSALFDNGRDFTLTYRQDYKDKHGREMNFRGLIAPQKGPITIGNDVWIGSYSSLAPGITIGNGAVIAAHSVVVKDVAPYMIVGGNPAKEIRPRFSETISNGLERTEWWDYELADIHEFSYVDPLVFIGEFLSRKDKLKKADYSPLMVASLIT